MNTFLTLDLNNKVPSANRDKMYVELAKLGWQKVSPVTTLWKKAWKSGEQVGDYENIAFKEAGTAAKAASIFEYDATVIVTENEPKSVKVAPPIAVAPQVTSAFAAGLRHAIRTAANKGSASPVTSSLLQMNPYLAEARRRNLAKRLGS